MRLMQTKTSKILIAVLIFSQTALAAAKLSKDEQKKWQGQIKFACVTTMNKNKKNNKDDQKLAKANSDKVCECIAKNHVVAASASESQKEALDNLKWVEKNYKNPQDDSEGNPLADFDLDLA